MSKPSATRSLQVLKDLPRTHVCYNNKSGPLFQNKLRGLCDCEERRLTASSVRDSPPKLVLQDFDHFEAFGAACVYGCDLLARLFHHSLDMMDVISRSWCRMLVREQWEERNEHRATISEMQ